MMRAAILTILWCVLCETIPARAELPQPTLLKPVSSTQAVEQPLPPPQPRSSRVPTESRTTSERAGSVLPTVERPTGSPDELLLRTVEPAAPAVVRHTSSSKMYRDWRNGSDNLIRRSNDIDQLRRSGFWRHEQINRDLYWLRTGRAW